MDDLEEFLKQQKVLAEMPEGDLEDYEARMRLRVKRSDFRFSSLDINYLLDWLVGQEEIVEIR